MRCTALILLLLLLPAVVVGQRSQQYRPQLHYSPRVNWMNDPNGLVYYDGEWHLFYQYYPREPVAKNIHWGHAVSKDLITWTELDIALAPENELVGIWSGSAIIDWHNVTGVQQDVTVHPMIAIYTWQRRGWQEQHMAYSLDRGRTWTRYRSNPIMPLNVNATRPTRTDLNASVVVFRDPKVMYHPSTGAWIAVISGGDHMQFHRSTDLINWTLVSRFGYEHGSHAGVWECPDLIDFSQPTSNRWVLIVSMDRNAVAGGSGIQYFIGSFDGYTFTNLQPRQTINWLDHGPDFYAGITYHNVPRYDNRRVMISWMNNWLYAQAVPTGPLWRGQMAMPRQLDLEWDSVNNAHFIRQKPVYELYSYSNKLFSFQRQNLSSCTPNILGNLASEVFMISAEFQRVTAKTILHFRLRLNTEHEEFTRVSYYGAENQLVFDRSSSGDVEFHPMFRTRFNMTLGDETLTTGVLELQIIVDRCSVETFVNGGKYAMTGLIFPMFEGYEMDVAVEGDDEIVLDYLELMLL